MCFDLCLWCVVYNGFELVSVCIFVVFVWCFVLCGFCDVVLCFVYGLVEVMLFVSVSCVVYVLLCVFVFDVVVFVEGCVELVGFGDFVLVSVVFCGFLV